MNEIIKKLASIAESLDEKGLFEESSVIDQIIVNAKKKMQKEKTTKAVGKKIKSKKKKLDPVGKEDDDIDNDGKVTKSDRYLKNRRKAIEESVKKEK